MERANAVLDQNLVLKADELFLAGEISTDGSGERATGLYLRDTRHLSRFDLLLNGGRLERLSAHVHDARHATVTLTNRQLRLANGDVIPPHTVALQERITLGDTLDTVFGLHNFGRTPLPLVLAFALAADFRDLFDIRGMPRAAYGECLEPRAGDEGVILGYRGLDDATVETALHIDQACSLVIVRPEHGAPEDIVPILRGRDDAAREPAGAAIPGVVISFDVILAAGASWQVRATVEPRPVPISRPTTLRPSATRHEAAPLSIETNNSAFNGFVRQSIADLNALQTTFPGGAMPAAGIPWFVAPFGRDSLIVGLQTLHFFPERAANTLRLLASLQGVKEDPARAEEPGKILHEMRYGEMARLGEIPHTPYYGSIDATPLFLLLFAETVSWGADESLYRELAAHARRAVEWIERYGDLDGDGFVEYRTDAEGTGTIRHQVWKDSWDSLNHADGRPVDGPVAAIEVQGYVYAAYRRLADVAARYGDAAWSARLKQRATALRQRVEAAFWLPDVGYYAQALDGNKEAVRVVSSNPGHLLFCGLPTPERAADVGARLSQTDMASGWGIRTLNAAAATYNPMSYHNGSVWPHDNSLIAAGLFSFGLAADGNAIATALFDAARSDPRARLPELYCGFPREERADAAPVAYPVSCSPQAWAAGAAPLLLRSMLGLSVDPAAHRLVIAPALPDWLDSVTIRHLPVLGRTVSLSLRRMGDDYEIESDRPVARGRPSFASAPSI